MCLKYSCESSSKVLDVSIYLGITAHNKNLLILIRRKEEIPERITGHSPMEGK